MFDSDWEMGMKEYDKDYTTILNLPKEIVRTMMTERKCQKLDYDISKATTSMERTDWEI